MKYIIILLSLVSHYSYAQQLTKQQLSRLTDVCKLWGDVKYFHPYLQYKSIPWDSAFAAAVPEILASGSKQEYENTLSKWLSVLNDPTTKVMVKNTMPSTLSAEQPSPLVTFKEGILTLSVRNLKDIQDYDSTRLRLKPLFSLADSSKYLLFDLRIDKTSVENEKVLESFFSDQAIDYIIGNGLSKPSLRTVAHEGFRPERLVGPYSTYFRVNNGKIINSGEILKETDQVRPIIFLINRYVSLPLIALTLQEAGRAMIISEGELNINFEETTIRYPMTDSINISMRKGELSSQYGVLDTRPDVVFNEENDPSVNVLKAISLLRKGISKKFQQNNKAVNAGLPQQENYPNEVYPSLGYRVLGIAKIYTVINYFFPNKTLMDRNWDSVFLVSLPRFVAAKNVEEYGLAVAEMYANIQDGHGGIRGGANWFGKLFGNFSPPVLVKFVEGKLVVTNIIEDSAAKQAGIGVGDIIHKIDGNEPMKKMDEGRKYIAASNEVSQTARLSSRILFTQKDSMATLLEIEDTKGARKSITLTGLKRNNALLSSKRRTLDNGPIFKLLTSNIGYVDMHRLESKMVDSMFTTFSNTKGFIMDMRGYPKGTAWDIAPRLTEENYVEAALFTMVMATTPSVTSEWDYVKQGGSFVSTQILPSTKKWRYKGKTVMLMNEETVSHAEHSGLFFKAANGTLFIGSQTAGANGNITDFYIPGNINLIFSGMQVSYPNGQTMQRIGLIPDVLVLPTIKGIREGRDEVLEKAIEVLQKQ